MESGTFDSGNRKLFLWFFIRDFYFFKRIARGNACRVHCNMDAFQTSNLLTNILLTAAKNSFLFLYKLCKCICFKHVKIAINFIGHKASMQMNVDFQFRLNLAIKYHWTWWTCSPVVKYRFVYLLFLASAYFLISCTDSYI